MRISHTRLYNNATPATLKIKWKIIENWDANAIWNVIVWKPIIFSDSVKLSALFGCLFVAGFRSFIVEITFQLFFALYQILGSKFVIGNDFFVSKGHALSHIIKITRNITKQNFINWTHSTYTKSVHQTNTKKKKIQNERTEKMRRNI